MSLEGDGPIPISPLYLLRLTDPSSPLITLDSPARRRGNPSHLSELLQWCFPSGTLCWSRGVLAAHKELLAAVETAAHPGPAAAADQGELGMATLRLRSWKPPCARAPGEAAGLDGIPSPTCASEGSPTAS